MMHHSRQFASFGLVLFWVILTPGVITAVDVGGVYDCNPPWRNDNIVTITFRIDRSQYPLKCAQGTTAGKPVFQTSPDGNVTYGANCTVTTDIRTSCLFISGTIGCGCTNSNDNGFYVVEYNFIFGPDYHRYWEAEIACFDSNFTKSITFNNIDSNCKPVPVANGTTTITPTTENGTSATSLISTTSTITLNTDNTAGPTSTAATTATNATTATTATTATNATTHQGDITKYVAGGICGLIAFIAIVVVIVLVHRHHKRGKVKKVQSASNGRFEDGDSKPAGEVDHATETRM